MDNPNMARARAKEAALPPERLRELMDYDPETGVVTSRVRRGRRGSWPAGRRVGTLNVHGYRTVNIDGILYPEHRAIWALMTGDWPHHEIDHINLDRADNRWANLRVVTRAENCRNSPGRPHKRVGQFKGITPSFRGTGWVAQISFQGNTHHIGTYPTQEDAHSAYVSASKRLHGTYGRTG